MKKALISPSLLFWLINIALLIVNLFQSVFTELAHDEAYYYAYAQQLDWGYFDHPPMIALLVHLGNFISNELGVRFFIILLQPLYLFLFWQIIKPKYPTNKQIIQYFLIAASIPLLLLYGFVAVPDAPLMFFSALFLYAFVRFSKTNHWGYAVLLGLTMAALAYSKYTSILVVGLAFISNWDIFKRKGTYLAILLTALLLIPHLYWQYNNDYVSFYYHLIGRKDSFQIVYLFRYLGTFFLEFNPLLTPLFICSLFAPKSNTVENRMFKTIAIGFFLFFLVSSFRGEVQAQWLIPVSFCVIAFLWQYIQTHRKAERYTYYATGFSLFIFLLLRIQIAFNPIGMDFEIYNNKAYNSAIKKEVGDIPVLFSRYNDAAKYAFYSKSPSFGLASLHSRTNQYQLWNMDESWIGKPVAVQVSPKVEGVKKIETVKGDFNYVIDPDYRPARNVKVRVAEWPKELSIGQKVNLELNIYNPYPYPIKMDGEKYKLDLVLKKHKYSALYIPFDVDQFVIQPRSEYLVKASFVLPKDLEKNKYEVGVYISHPIYRGWYNSQSKRFDIK